MSKSALFEWARRVILSLALLMPSSAAFASASITLAWDPDPDGNNIQGYLVFYGTDISQPTLSVDAGASTSATISNLDDGQSYYFSVAAYDANHIVGTPTGELTYVTPGGSELLPGMVTLTPAVDTPRNVTLNWSPPPAPNVLGYLVYSGTTSGMPTTQMDAGGANSATFTNLIPGQIYYLSVASYDTDGLLGPPSGEISYVVPGGISPTLTPAGGNGATLNWHPDGEMDAQGYIVYYGTNGINPELSVDVGANTSAEIDNLIPWQAYYFLVVSYDANSVVSATSSELSYVAPGISYFQPGMPALLPVADSSGSVTFAWSPPLSGGAQGYRVSYGTNSVQPELSKDAGANTFVTISNLLPGQTYYFSVAAYDTNQVPGPPSSQLSYPVPGVSYSPPDMLSLNAETVPGGGVSLSWNPPPAMPVQGYILYYGTNGSQPELSADAGANNYLAVSNLTPGQTYYFSVVAYDPNQAMSPPSAEISYGVPANSYFEPAMLTLTPGMASGSSVALAWNPPPAPGVQGYTVYYGTNSVQPELTMDAGLNTSVVLSNLVPGQTYYFSAAAYYPNAVAGPAGEQLTYAVPDTTYYQPGMLTVATGVISLGGVTFAWNPPSSAGVQGYRVYYGTNAAQPDFSMDAGTNTSITLSNLGSGQTYYFSVAAYYQDGTVGPISGQLPEVAPDLAAYQSGMLTATRSAASVGSVDLAWNPPSAGGTQDYMVYYGTNGAQPESWMDAGTNTAVTITNLAAGGTYFFSVVAYFPNSLAGPPSDPISYVAPEVSYFQPLQVTLTPGVASSGSVVLVWSAPLAADAQGYTVLYGTNEAQPELAFDAGTQPFAIIGNLVPGLTYYFSVVADYANGAVVPAADEVSYLVPMISYFQPGGLQVTASATPGGGVTVAWSPPAAVGVQAYRLYYGTNGDQPELSVGAGTNTSINMDSLVPGLTYFFEVAAYFANAAIGPASDEVSYLVPGISDYAPGQLTLTPGLTGATLAWNPPAATGVQGYKVLFGTNGSQPDKSVDVGDNTSVNLTNLTAGQTYNFSVAAYDAQSDVGPASDALAYLVPGLVKLTPGASPGDPVNISFPVAPTCWYEIQASVDMGQWDTLSTTPVYQDNQWMNYSDSDSPNFPQRYYRVVTHQGNPPGN